MKKTVLLLVFLAVLSACRHTAEKRFAGNALGTTYHIIIQGKGKRITKKDIENTIRELNLSLSTYISNSLISAVNRGEKRKADKHFRYVYEQAYKIYRETDGLYDPTVGILVNAWGFGPGKPVPDLEKDSAKVDSLLHYVGFDKVKILSDGTIVKQFPAVFIDFNSIAKGYVIDQVGETIRNKGYRNYLVEIGGEVLAKGRNIKEDRPWVIGIDYPVPGAGSEIAEIELTDRAVATSGNYRKFHIDKKTGRKFVHTINTKTGYPAVSHLLSASVLAPTCTEADGWATACMASGLEKSKSYLLKHKELDGVLIYADSTGNIKIWHTPGMDGLLKRE